MTTLIQGTDLPLADWASPSTLPTRSGGPGAGSSVGALVRRRATETGDRVYAEDARSERVLTFDTVEHWRLAWERAPFDAGTTVGLSIADPLRCAAALVGAVAAGLWVAPLDPATPDAGPSGLAALLSRDGTHVLVTDRPAPTGGACDWVDLESLLLGSTAAQGVRGPLASTGGVVLSSSGTTGAPKVVRLTQAQLLHTARSVVAHHDLTPSDRCFNSLPLFHINAEVVALLSSLVAGSCVVLDAGFHRTDFWELMGRRRVTWINAVPAIISRLADLRAGESVPAGIRFVRSASAPLPVATADRFEAATGIRVIETYGMTEAASQIAAHPLSVPRRAGSVGVPVGIDLRIVGDESAEVGPRHGGPGEVGEIEIRGPSVIGGYEGGVHAERVSADGWLKTGDLGWRDEEGFLYLIARTDDVINRGGEKIFPREIEEIISADPAVRSVAVVGQRDPELGQVPVAYMVIEGVESADDVEPAALAAERINTALAASLVRARRPVELHLLESLPAGATGKVRRRALRASSLSILHSFAGA